jgi:class 3 adenylate cyclase/tetratricopeptide (TPR) repeat protein
MSDIAGWLEQIGLGQYSPAFQSNGIDFDSLEEVTNDDLKDIGVSKLSDRKLLLKEIDRLILQRAQVLGERRLLTMLFCDLVGSTPLSQQLDPEQLRLALRQYQDTVFKAITKYGGTVTNIKGDGVMAYFGWPRPDEDQAGQAARAALEIVSAVPELELRSGSRLSCRVGIASGRVVVGGEQHADSAYGETPNLAARLQSAAGENRVVIEKVTRNLIGQGFLAEPLTPLSLKGFDRPVEAWEVVEERKYLDRFESLHEASSQFVGRDAELRGLMEGWKCTEQQRGQCCLIVGEAGIGKSRLVREFELKIRQENCPVLRYQCSPYHTNSAFHPVIQRVEKAAGFSPQGESASTKLAKISALFGETSDDPKVLQLIADLLSIPHDMTSELSTMTAAQRRQLTINVLVEQAVQLSRSVPVLLLLEDAHWIDPSSLELLQELIKRTEHERIFAVVTTRPGRALPLPGTPSQLALSRISDADVAALATSMRGGIELSESEVAAIVAKVDGVPLFAEELTSTLIEHKADARPMELPENVQSSVMARLDMLGGAKYVAQLGSIIGKDFKHAQLAALATELVPDLDKSVGSLVQSGLLLESSGSQDKTYSFRHALVRDVAYESLLREQRRQLHERLVRDVIPDDEKQRVPELVAHHLTEAGLEIEALSYWKQSGYRASRASAHYEAIAHFKKGLTLIRELPEGPERDRLELGFQAGLTGPLIASTGYTSEAVKAVVARTSELSKKVDDAPEIFSVLYSRWGFLLTSGSIFESYNAAREFSSLAERQGNKDALYARYRMLGASRMCLGELEAARLDLEQAISLYRKEEHEGLMTAYGVAIRVAARCFMGEVLWLKGFPDSARGNVTLALEEAKSIGHTHSIGMALYFCGLVSFLYRDANAVREYTEEMMNLASRQPLAAWPTLGKAMQGWAQLAEGDFDGGLSLMRQGIDSAKKAGISMFMPFLTTRLAEISLSLDQVADAESIIADSEALMDRTGERNYEGELRRLKGELAWRQGLFEEAEAQFCAALEIAGKQEAKAVELRATTSYARFLAARGQPDRGCAMLSSIAAWFEEGKDGHDLVAAEAAIAALKGQARQV